MVRDVREHREHTGRCHWERRGDIASCSEKEPEDIAVEDDGARIIVDSVSVEFVRGATVDFEVRSRCLWP